MWSFAIGMFMIALSPNSLRLTAIYGLTGGLVILLTGAILGDWVDRYPRMKGMNDFNESLSFHKINRCQVLPPSPRTKGNG